VGHCRAASSPGVSTCRLPGRAGRPSRPLEVVADRYHFVGVNLTADEATAVATNLRAEVVALKRSALRNRDPGAVVATVAELTEQLRSQVPPISSLGVSLGGHVRDHEVVTRAPFLGWAGDVSLALAIEEATGLATIVDNDLLALTRAEHWFGAGRRHERFAVLTIGASVGYGLVMHDRIVDSPDAGVGLVGHYPLDPLGPPCPEGHRGCANAMLSMPSIEFRVSSGLARSVTYEEALEYAADGQPVATSVIEESARALGRLLAAIVNLTMVPLILVTGEGSALASVAADAVAAGAQRDRDARASTVRYEVQPVDFSNHARGAAVAALQASVFGERLDLA
jgi:predicted NBD/HSP70 family sugar kinase